MAKRSTNRLVSIPAEVMAKVRSLSSRLGISPEKVIQLAIDKLDAVTEPEQNTAKAEPIKDTEPKQNKKKNESKKNTGSKQFLVNVDLVVSAESEDDAREKVDRISALLLNENFIIELNVLDEPIPND